MKGLTILVITMFFWANLIIAQKNIITRDAEDKAGEFTKVNDRITYRWTFEGQQYEFGLNFVRGWSYMQDVYKRKNHQHGNYNRFIREDPFKQDLVVLAGLLRDLAKDYGVDECDLALSFVQALPYQDMDGYQRYAVEALIDMQGDCSDTSVLFAGILAAWNYDCIFLNYPDHLAVGLWSTRTGSYYSYRGRNFLYCETTGTGWIIGKIPEDCYYASFENVSFN